MLESIDLAAIATEAAAFAATLRAEAAAPTPEGHAVPMFNAAAVGDAARRMRAVLPDDAALADCGPKGRWALKMLAGIAEAEAFQAMQPGGRPPELVAGKAAIAETVDRLAGALWAGIGDALASDAQPQGQPGAGNGQDTASAMRHGPDFRSLAWGDAQYAFTSSQAAVVKVLWGARDNRTPDVGEQFIIEAVDSCGSRLRDIFPKHPAWGTLIVPGRTKGTFRLAE